MSDMNPNTPIVGQPILVAFFDGNHTVHHSVAHVLSIGPVDLETGKPTISVAYPDPDADPSTLSSASWFKGYIRQVGVQHINHPEVLNSHFSIAYGNPLDLDDVERPALPQPTGLAANPIFDRADDTVPSHVSLGQAALVQGAKEPGPTVVSPLINDDLSPAPAVEPDGGVFAKGVGSYPGPIPAAQVPADAVEPVSVADATLEAAPPTSAEV